MLWLFVTPEQELGQGPGGGHCYLKVFGLGVMGSQVLTSVCYEYSMMVGPEGIQRGQEDAVLLVQTTG